MDVKSLAIELVTLLDFIIAILALLSDGLDKPYAASLIAASREDLSPPCAALADENSYCALMDLLYDYNRY